MAEPLSTDLRKRVVDAVNGGIVDFRRDLTQDFH